MEIGGGVKVESRNLGDLLRIRDEDLRSNFNRSSSSNAAAGSGGGGGGRSSGSSGLTLLAVLSEKRGPPPPLPLPAAAADEPLQSVQSTRTLWDIIREDQMSGLGGGRRDGRRSWRHLRDKIRLRQRGSGSAWSSASDGTMMATRRASTSARFHSGESASAAAEVSDGDRGREVGTSSGRFEQTSNRDGERGGGDAASEEAQEESPEQPVRTSLMSLLAENDRQMGVEGSAYVMMRKDEEEAMEEVAALAAGDSGVVGGAEYNNCCVCMVRHKGAAFIPCGHTFCRLCSRELWVQRGNCPLCNNYIIEILDIF